MEAEGYQTADYWTEEGQQWLAFSQATHPTFWVKTELGWSLRLMLEEVPMPWDWPVEVNYHEAKAFCNWKSTQTGESIRLPTEDEWYRLYAVSGLDPKLPSPEQANIELKYGPNSFPVDHFQHGDFMMFRAMSGNGPRPRFILSKAFKSILSMMILVPQPSMANII